MKKTSLYAIIIFVVAIGLFLVTLEPSMDSPMGTGLRIKPQFVGLYAVIVIVGLVIFFKLRKRK